MINPENMKEIVRNYDKNNISIGVVGSHSALDVCDGAKDEGFSTLVIAQKGREKTYSKYFKTKNLGNNTFSGVVDKTMVLNKFGDIVNHQEELVNNNVLFIPNRSFVVYTGIDNVENTFKVPLVGSRNLLRCEERSEEQSYYWLLDKAGLPYPEKIDNSENIDGLVIVKLPHAKKRLERGFFTAASHKEYVDKSSAWLSQGVITQNDLDNARIEKYKIGPVFNFNFFYSPLDKEVELLGVDWRFETSLDGHVRLPAQQQMTLSQKEQIPEFTVTGHSTATLRESLLEKVFDMAEKYIKAEATHHAPGVLGPFCLQTTVDKDLNFYIYDVAPRIGGGTNIHMAQGHPYGNTLWRTPMSSGRRIMREIRRALDTDDLEKLVS